MELSQVLPEQGSDEVALIERALLNTAVSIENPHEAPALWRMNGKILETSLVRSAASRGINVQEVLRAATIVNSLPFNAVNKFSVSLVRDGSEHRLNFFGAPDILVSHSTLDATEKERVLKRIETLARSGERVLGVASKVIELKEDFSFAKDLSLAELSFTGLVTFRDPVRPNVRDAMLRVADLGVRVVIVTGDHRGTAEAIAHEVGMDISQGSIIDAEELKRMSDDELKARLPTLKVIARVTPTDKVRIVKAFQSAGEVVAMTGDGVNDAPSIKQADVGIAMGTGTEVARSVADLVLLDDNFETITAAVEEGRRIISNIRKVIVYLLSTVADELFLIGGALLAGIPLPLNALQILWVNFFSDSFPAIAFAFERGKGSPHARSARSGLFDPTMRFLIVVVGFCTSGLLFLLYWLLLQSDTDEQLVRTFIFACFGTYSLILAFPVRSLHTSILNVPLFSNVYMLAGVGAGILLMAAAIYVPYLQSVFGTVALPALWVLAVAGVGLTNIVAIEFGKYIFRRRIV